MAEIWAFRKNPASIFIFSYKYAFLGLLLTHSKKKKFLTIFFNENRDLGGVTSYVLKKTLQFHIKGNQGPEGTFFLF